MLCKCSGKYIDIYFMLKITFYYLFSYVKLKLTNITIYKEKIEMIH